MQYVVGALVGLAWGALLAWLNAGINRRAIQKNTSQAVMGASFLRMLIDIVGLGTVFLLRRILPFNFEATIVGTAASLGMLTVYFAFRLSKPEKKPEKTEQSR